MQETANKQKRITLKTLHEMLDGMSVELAEKVHLLFMANYIDYSDYDFRDENQVENYCWCYRDLFVRAVMKQMGQILFHRNAYIPMTSER